MTPRPARWLVVLAGAHTALGLEEGLLDGGDYGLLWVALPFVVLTLGAAASVRRLPILAVALCAVALVLAVLGLGIYLLGLFHLPQAVLALLVTARASARRAAPTH